MTGYLFLGKKKSDPEHSATNSPVPPTVPHYSLWFFW